MTEGSGAGIWGSGKNIAESQEASQNLRWEKAKKFDIGIDGQLFNSSVEFTVDFSVNAVREFSSNVQVFPMKWDWLRCLGQT